MRLNLVNFVFVVLSTLLCAQAKAAELALEQVNGAKVGMAYREVRERLNEFGFAPASPTNDKNRCGARTIICKKYPEVEACSGIGTAPCRFVFRYPGGRKIVVITNGENLVVTKLFEE